MFVSLYCKALRLNYGNPTFLQLVPKLLNPGSLICQVSTSLSGLERKCLCAFIHTVSFAQRHLNKGRSPQPDYIVQWTGEVTGIYSVKARSCEMSFRKGRFISLMFCQSFPMQCCNCRRAESFSWFWPDHQERIVNNWCPQTCISIITGTALHFYPSLFKGISCYVALWHSSTCVKQLGDGRLPSSHISVGLSGWETGSMLICCCLHTEEQKHHYWIYFTSDDNRYLNLWIMKSWNAIHTESFLSFCSVSKFLSYSLSAQRQARFLEGAGVEQMRPRVGPTALTPRQHRDRAGGAWCDSGQRVLESLRLDDRTFKLGDFCSLSWQPPGHRRGEGWHWYKTTELVVVTETQSLASLWTRSYPGHVHTWKSEARFVSFLHCLYLMPFWFRIVIDAELKTLVSCGRCIRWEPHVIKSLVSYPSLRSEGRGLLVGIQRIISLTHNPLWLPGNRLTDDVPQEGDLV